MGLLSSALLKNILPRPMTGELLAAEINVQGGCVLYFDNGYFELIDKSLRENYFAGEFANSNAEHEWNDLMAIIGSAEDTNENTENLKIYWLTIEPGEKQKPKIEINEVELCAIIESEKPERQKWIGKMMNELTDDVKRVYVGHNICFNYHGFLSIERTIEKGQDFPSVLNLKPVLDIAKIYQAEVKTLRIKSNIGTEKIYVEIYFE